MHKRQRIIYVGALEASTLAAEANGKQNLDIRKSAEKRKRNDFSRVSGSTVYWYDIFREIGVQDPMLPSAQQKRSIISDTDVK